MSLKNFLTKIWDQIKNLFGGLPNQIKTAIQIGVTITENIKMAVDSPIADILTTLIPGNVDDAIKDKLRTAIPVFLTELKLVESSLNLTQPDAIVKAASDVIKTMNNDIKPGVLHQLSILIAQMAADGKLAGEMVFIYRNGIMNRNLKLPVNKTVRQKYIEDESILNFFDNRATNASAESFNAKINALRATSRGIRDTTFFLFRLTNIYA
ncbi:transposase [Mucilaginibacter sp. SP1R1]|uniref:transposase n=1 Tax=Mucilaginibacter sp. SP1R1 TaxID=2723091 RepID=UPI0017FC9A57|nr:transposase [Mucilaginibacter sp. SP1R1]MBB6149607.1 hypothetical protein [Mucilaginibacter sp. SP1R1]